MTDLIIITDNINALMCFNTFSVDTTEKKNSTNLIPFCRKVKTWMFNVWIPYDYADVKPVIKLLSYFCLECLGGLFRWLIIHCCISGLCIHLIFNIFPPHYHLDIKGELKSRLPDKWIGRAGPNDGALWNWPPDITPFHVDWFVSCRDK